MRTIIVFPIIVVLLLGTPLHAQDNTARRHIVSTFAAINKGDCREAQRSYNTWKKLSGETNAEIETMIRECYAMNPEKDPEYENIPASSLMITKKPVATKITFDKAKLMCEELGLGGFDNWRLPTTNELFVIFNAGKNHGRKFGGDSKNHILRDGGTYRGYDIMHSDGTTFHHDTNPKDNMPFDCFCVRHTIGN